MSQTYETPPLKIEFFPPHPLKRWNRGGGDIKKPTNLKILRVFVWLHFWARQIPWRFLDLSILAPVAHSHGATWPGAGGRCRTPFASISRCADLWEYCQEGLPWSEIWRNFWDKMWEEMWDSFEMCGKICRNWLGMLETDVCQPTFLGWKTHLYTSCTLLAGIRYMLEIIAILEKKRLASTWKIWNLHWPSKTRMYCSAQLTWESTNPATPKFFAGQQLKGWTKSLVEWHWWVRTHYWNFIRAARVSFGGRIHMLILMKTVGHVLLMQLAMLDRLEETMLQLFFETKCAA